MSKLSLGPIPKMELVRLAITVPAPLKSVLDRYAEVHAQTYGQKADAAALIPHIVQTFLSRDKEFQKLLKLTADQGNPADPS